MYELVIKGFKNKDEAETFLSWYSGSGEQDASIWFECRIQEGLPIREYMDVDHLDKETGVWNGNQLTMVVK